MDELWMLNEPPKEESVIPLVLGDPYFPGIPMEDNPIPLDGDAPLPSESSGPEDDPEKELEEDMEEDPEEEQEEDMESEEHESLGDVEPINDEESKATPPSIPNLPLSGKHLRTMKTA